MNEYFLRAALLALLAFPLQAFGQAQTYTVTTSVDAIDPADNELSLREAIAAANMNDADGDVILFDPSLNGQTISLALGELVIADDLTIGDELRPVPVSIDAGGMSRILSVATSGASGDRQVTLFNLTFSNGLADNGGALYVNEGASVSCWWCRFDGNAATGDAPGLGGGAVYAAGSMMVRRATFSNNQATTGAGNGGAVLVTPTGSFSMVGGTFEANVANRAGGAVENNGGTASFEGVLFFANIAGPDAASAAPGNGGAIHVSGTGTTSIQGGVAVGNLAFLEGGAFWNGAGLMTVDGVTIGGRNRGEFNVASGDAADTGGGGLFNNGGTLEVVNATILANKADGASGSGGGILSDGGILKVSDSMMRWNSSSRAGGAIESTNGAELIIDNVDFLENTTGPAPGNGAAIHVTGPGNTTITGGTATNNDAALEGGAFWNGSGTMTLSGTQIGGANFTNANIARGDGADNGGGGLFNNGGTVIADNISVVWNMAVGAAGSGGGILSDGGSLTVSNSFIRGNSSVRAGGGIEATNNASLIIEEVTFLENITGPAPGNGGAVHVTGPGTTMMKSSTATGNSAENEGGGLWNSGAGTMTVLNSTVSGNTAPLGGGLFQQAGDNSTFNVWYSTIARNSATTGGGFQSDGGAPALFNTILAENTASDAGPECAGSFTSDGFNLVQQLDGCAFPASATDLTNVQALLNDLADNGGPTLTHSLQDASPAIDAGSCSPDVMVDQRGIARMAPCDIGAFEFGTLQVGDSGITFTLIDAGSDTPVPRIRPDSERLQHHPLHAARSCEHSRQRTRHPGQCVIRLQRHLTFPHRKRNTLCAVWRCRRRLCPDAAGQWADGDHGYPIQHGKRDGRRMAYRPGYLHGG